MGRQDWRGETAVQSRWQAVKSHSSTQGQRGERKERSVAAERQQEVREKQAQGANAETGSIKKPGHYNRFF